MNSWFLNPIDPYDNSWITLNLTGTQSNKAAIGAKVFLKAEIFGEEVLQVREVRALNGGGQSSLAASFGLGYATSIKSIEIHWPSGIINKYTDVDVNQILNLTENDNVTSVSLAKNEAKKDVQLNYSALSGHYDIVSKKDGYEISVVDLSGKIVVENQKIIKGNNAIDLSHLPVGMYLVQAKSEEGFSSQAFVR